MIRLRSAALAFVTALSLLSLNVAAAAQNPPLQIAKEGYLFAGGQYVEGNPPMTGQVYAEYQIPARRTHRYPIVMIEGGGQTGANFTGTPDGREGWAQYFLRHGFAIYVVDQPGRGRSPYNAPAYGNATTLPIEFLLSRFAAPERYDKWPQAHLHTQWPGVAKQGDPVFDHFVSQETPSIADFALQQKLNTAALIALFDKIGPGILLTHSQSGAFGWPVADARPNLIKAIVAVEPSGPPVHDTINNGPPNWFSDAPAVKTYGLEMVPLTYAPPVSASSPLAFERRAAVSPDLAPCWVQKAPARTLPNLARVPIVMIQSEASYHAAYDYCTSEYLSQAGVKHTYIQLAKLGIRGNGHMMMLEKNNAAIAAVITGWLGVNVR